MNFLKDRRVILGLGAALALAAGLVLAWIFIARDHGPAEAPPASQGGLIVQTGRDDDLKLDPKRPLRCFVNGQFVGQLPLDVCAQRNGVATGALDVGIDPSGSLAASNGMGANITPLPPQQPQPVTVEAQATGNDVVVTPGQASGPSSPSQPVVAECMKFVVGEGWRPLPASMSQSACLQALFGGRCAEGDEVLYGRWGPQTLRLTQRRIENSRDSRDFEVLLDPWSGCAGPG